MKLSLLKAEIRRHLLYEGINRFYFFSIIFWPVLSFIQLIFNFQIFPLEMLHFLGIYSEVDLFYYMFIGYTAFVIFQTAVQSAWSFSFEKNQGTLSQLFMSPINRTFWLYARAVSVIVTNGWFYFILFVGVNLWYLRENWLALGYLLLSCLLLIVASVIWGAFIMVFFIIMRDGTILFTILEGPQEAFAGVKTPVQVMPQMVQGIAGIFPLTYTILLLRGMLITKENATFYFLVFLAINLLLILATVIILKLGEKHLRQTGGFDLY